MEKTLVIHPDDRSTDFLKPIYSGIKGKMVVTGGHYGKNTIRKLIEISDRVIMLGHGSPYGLFSVGRFSDCTNGYIVDNTMIEALEYKLNNIYIWCHANQFVERHKLNGFYSGMFISEYGEANACGVGTYEGEIEQSNDLFSEIVGKNINTDSQLLCEIAKQEYYIHDSKVNEYNNTRLNWK